MTIIVVGILFFGRGEVAQPAAIASPTATATPTKTNTPDQTRVFCGTLAESSRTSGQGSGPNSFELRSPTGEQGAPFVWTLNAAPVLGTYLCGRFTLGAPMLGLVRFVGPGEPDYIPQTYVNPTYKFSVVLPPPYRKSARLSIASTGGARPAAQDAFTARTEEDEAALAGTRCDTACAIWNYVAVIHVFTGTGTQTPRQFYSAFSFSRDEKIEDVVVDGHQAIKVTNGATYPLQYLVKDGDRMVSIAFGIYPFPDFSIPPGASKDKLEQLLASFKFVP